MWRPDHHAYLDRRRILIVAEDFYSRWYMRRVLAPYSPCDTVVRGEEAVEMFQLSCRSGTPYELIFLDMSLSEMSADTVLRQFRDIERNYAQDSRRSAIFLLIDDLHRRGLHTHVRLDCEGLLVKPVEKGELLSTVKKLGFVTV